MAAQKYAAYPPAQFVSCDRECEEEEPYRLPPRTLLTLRRNGIREQETEQGDFRR